MPKLSKAPKNELGYGLERFEYVIKPGGIRYRKMQEILGPIKLEKVDKAGYILKECGLNDYLYPKQSLNEVLSQNRIEDKDVEFLSDEFIADCYLAKIKILHSELSDKKRKEFFKKLYGGLSLDVSDSDSGSDSDYRTLKNFIIYLILREDESDLSEIDNWEKPTKRLKELYSEFRKCQDSYPREISKDNTKRIDELNILLNNPIERKCSLRHLGRHQYRLYRDAKNENDVGFNLGLNLTAEQYLKILEDYSNKIKKALDNNDMPLLNSYFRRIAMLINIPMNRKILSKSESESENIKIEEKPAVSEKEILNSIKIQEIDRLKDLYSICINNINLFRIHQDDDYLTICAKASILSNFLNIRSLNKKYVIVAGTKIFGSSSIAITLDTELFDEKFIEHYLPRMTADQKSEFFENLIYSFRNLNMAVVSDEKNAVFVNGWSEKKGDPFCSYGNFDMLYKLINSAAQKKPKLSNEQVISLLQKLDRYWPKYAEEAEIKDRINELRVELDEAYGKQLNNEYNNFMNKVNKLIEPKKKLNEEKTNAKKILPHSDLNAVNGMNQKGEEQINIITNQKDEKQINISNKEETDLKPLIEENFITNQNIEENFITNQKVEKQINISNKKEISLESLIKEKSKKKELKIHLKPNAINIKNQKGEKKINITNTKKTDLKPSFKENFEQKESELNLESDDINITNQKGEKKINITNTKKTDLKPLFKDSKQKEKSNQKSKEYATLKIKNPFGFGITLKKINKDTNKRIQIIAKDKGKHKPLYNLDYKTGKVISEITKEDSNKPSYEIYKPKKIRQAQHNNLRKQENKHFTIEARSRKVKK